MPSRFLVHLALFSVSLIYSANYTIAKTITPDYIHPFSVVAFRVAGAALLLLLFTKAEPIKSWKDYGHLALCSVFGVATNMLLFFKGISLTSPVNASILMTLVPILVLLFSTLFLKEKVTWLRLLGVFLGFLGAFLILSGGGFEFSGDTFWGDVFILLNATSYAIYLVLVKPLMKKYKPMTVVRWLFLFGLLIVAPVSYPHLVATDWASFPIWGWGVIAFIVLLVTFLAYFLNAWSIQKSSPTLVSAYIYLQPVLATVIAIIFRDESVSLLTGFYSILIFVGVGMVSWRGAERK